MNIGEYTLDAPWLALLASVGVLVAAIAVRVVTGRTGLRGSRRVTLWCAVMLAAISAGLAAGDLRRAKDAGRRAVVLLVDASASARGSAAEAAHLAWRALRSALGPDDLLGAVAFASDAHLLAALRHPEETPLRLPSLAFVDGQSLESRLAPAVRTVQSLFPPGYRAQVVVVSDGGGAFGGMPLPTGTAILPVGTERIEDVAMLALHMSGSQSSEGDGATVELSIASTVVGKANVRVTADGGQPVEVTVELFPGLTPVSVALDRLPLPGSKLVAEVESEVDGLHGNERLVMTVPRLPRSPHVLVIDGTAQFIASRALVAAIRQVGIVTEQVTPSQASASLEALDRYDAVIITDTSAQALAIPAQERLVAWTLAGGGLAMIGSPLSFAPGGWAETPVDRALPVSARAQRDDDRRVAVCIALDVSGSMRQAVGDGATTKLDQANRGSELAMRMVMDGDWFGVLATDSSNRWVVPMAPLSDRAQTRSAILANEAGGGGIYVYTSLAEAYEALEVIASQQKFVIVFADGHDADEQQGTLDLASRRRTQNNIVTSTIAIGQGKDVKYLQQLANAGGGRSLLTEDAESLPLLFSSEVVRLTGGYIDERRIDIAVTTTGVLSDGIPFRSSPPLGGMIATTPRPDSTVWLTPTGGNFPLLATRRYGLGRTLAFTSDARDRWASEWLGWDGFAATWQRWVRWLASGGAQSGAADLGVTFDGDVAVIEVGHPPVAGGKIHALLRRPDDTSELQILNQGRPDASSARFHARPLGAYRVDAWIEGVGAEAIPLGAAMFSRQATEESDPTHGQLVPLVAAAAAHGGGRVETGAAALGFAPRRAPASEPAPEPFALAGIASLLLFTFARKFPRLWPDRTPAVVGGTEAVLGAWAARRQSAARNPSAAVAAIQADEPRDGELPSSGPDVPRAAPKTNETDGGNIGGVSRLLEAKRHRDRQK